MPLQGDLSEFSLADIIQLVDLSKQTGGVHIVGERDGKPVEGWIFFKHGQCIAARLGRLSGKEALYTFFTFPAGSFIFEEGEDLPPREITGSNEALIIEGVRRVDEWEELEQTAPSLDTVVSLVTTPGQRRNEISLAPEEWRILTLVDSRNTVAQIAERSGLGDMRARQIVAHLLEAGLVELKEIQVGERLIEELGHIAEENLGHSARVLLEDAFKRQGTGPEEDATPADVVAVCERFERSIALLVGPSRARQLVADMLLRARQIIGESVWDAAVG